MVDCFHLFTISYNAITLNPLTKNLASNSNASALNGGNHCPVFAIICQTNQLPSSDVYLFDNDLLIKGANDMSYLLWGFLITLMILISILTYDEMKENK